MLFYLGTHETSWLTRTDVPLFISRRRLAKRTNMPQAVGRWALDSGAFTEVKDHGGWSFETDQYVAEVLRDADEICWPDWVAPMDWPCEPVVLEQTGLTVRGHQENTLANYLWLREELGDLVVPVLQGWQRDDYLLHAADYYRAGVDLHECVTVGIGSVCRRQSTNEARAIVRALEPLNLKLHGFGVKKDGLRTYADALVSADSMAWSADAKMTPRRLPGHTHANCANCLDFALLWRRELLGVHHTESMGGTMHRRVGIAAAVLFVATVWMANSAIQKWGPGVGRIRPDRHQWRTSPA